MYKTSARSALVQSVMAQANRLSSGTTISGDVPPAVLEAHRASKDKPVPTVHGRGVQIRKGAVMARATA
jgi:hypothetical protein